VPKIVKIRLNLLKLFTEDFKSICFRTWCLCFIIGVHWCRLQIEELTEQATAVSQSGYSEEEHARRLELAMTEIRRQADEQEQQREMQYTERLAAVKQEASTVREELNERLSAMDSACEKLRVEKETAIAELEERHRIRLLSIAESQEEQV